MNIKELALDFLVGVLVIIIGYIVLTVLARIANVVAPKYSSRMLEVATTIIGICVLVFMTIVIGQFVRSLV